MSRLSGPLLDRIDVHVGVPPVEVAALTATGRAESSREVRARVSAARRLQRERFERGLVSQPLNVALSPAELDAVAALDAEGSRLLRRAVNELGLSARAFVRIRRVARSIADLERAERVGPAHVEEAIQGRMLDHPVVG